MLVKLKQLILLNQFLKSFNDTIPSLKLSFAAAALIVIDAQTIIIRLASASAGKRQVICQPPPLLFY